MIDNVSGTMPHARALPPPVEEVFESIDGEHDADELFSRITTNGANHLCKVTDLTLIIDGANWTDTADDIWSTAIRSLAPLSTNLQHLNIVIKGSFLFTRLNYIRPVIHTQAPYGCSRDDSDYDSDSSQPVVARSSRTKKIQEMTKETPNLDIKYYKKKALSHDKVKMHVTGEKAIVSALSSLKKPVPRITIQGYMELSLRRQIIADLNPDWDISVHCWAQAGYALDDSVLVEEAERRENACLSTGVDMVHVRTGATDALQDGEDFGLKKEYENASKLTAGWIVPTGKAGRQIWGWKAATTRTWKGPSERYTLKLKS